MTPLAMTLIYLLAAVLGVVVCRSFAWPPVLGYLLVGVVIGPHALGLVHDAESVRALGGFGVVFLMFAIGLDFSLPRLRAIRRHVLGLGTLQVMATMLFGLLGLLGLHQIAPALTPSHWTGDLALAAALAMSSTALLLKLMGERLELESEHGRRVLGVLLLQDLAVVPLLVLIPALGATAGELANALGWAILKAAALLTLLLIGGPRAMRWWLHLVARRKSEELFVLNVLLLTLGLAWLTEQVGLSLALGAFVAGMLIAETPYRQQVETDIRPFHDVLLGLFFINIGMQLDLALVLQRWPLVLALLALPLLLKTLLVSVLARILGATPGTALRTGIYLAQAGEFGVVLLTLALDRGLLTEALFSPILASMVLSMLLTPLMVANSNAVVLRLISSEWLLQSLQMTRIASRAMGVSEHVLICGFGRCGQNLARVLERQGIAYMALDLDPDRVRQASAAGDAVAYGDAARLQALMAAGLARAAAVVVSYLDTPSALRVLAQVRAHAPQVPVIVRTQDDHDLERLQAAGATEVVPEAIEGSLMLASHALALLGVPVRRVIRLVQDQRDARYQLLRGYFHGADDRSDDETEQERLVSLTLEADSYAVGRSLTELALENLAVRLLSVRRSSRTEHQPVPDTVLQAGDTLLLSGHAGALEHAQLRLLHGSGAPSLGGEGQ